MQINNIEGLSSAQIRQLVSQGGKFVMYKRCISIILMTFNNPTDIYFIKPGQSAVTPGLGVLFINLFLGWWGIPWGPIYTIGNITNILSGGKNVTTEVMAHINQQDSNYATGNNYNLPGQVANTNTASSNSGYNIPASNSTSNSNTSNATNNYNMPSSNSNSNASASSNNAYNIPDKG